MRRLLLLALLLAPAAAMDFVGQMHNERTFQIMVVVFGLVGFVVGWLEQNFRWTFLFLAAGGGISAVICLPDWPWWNLHPVEWLPEEEEEEEEEDDDGEAGAEMMELAAAAEDGTEDDDDEERLTAPPIAPKKPSAKKGRRAKGTKGKGADGHMLLCVELPDGSEHEVLLDLSGADSMQELQVLVMEQWKGLSGSQQDGLMMQFVQREGEDFQKVTRSTTIATLRLAWALRLKAKYSTSQPATAEDAASSFADHVRPGRRAPR